MNYSKQNPFDMDSRFKSDYELLSRNFDNRVERMGSDGVVSCAIYGLRGSGKSEFLSRYFNEERCRRFAAMGQLYPRIKAVGSVNPIELFASICKSISEYAEKYVDKERMPQFETEGENTFEAVSERLENMVAALKENGYRVSVVIDEFQRISQAEQIEGIHYGKFLNLYETDKTHMGFIVVTDFDFRINEHYTEQCNTSFFVDVFANSYEKAAGMSRLVFDSYIAGFLPEGSEPVFNYGELSLIYSLGGGIPALSRKLAQIMFALKAKGVNEGLENFLRIQAMQELRLNYFDKWCSNLSDSQKAFLKKLDKEGIQDMYLGDEGEAFNILRNRCFIIEDIGADGYGQARFCCELFRDYVRESFGAEYDSVYTVPAEKKQEPDDMFTEEKHILADEMAELYDIIDAKLEACNRTFRKRFVSKSISMYQEMLDILRASQMKLAGKCDSRLLFELRREYDDIKSRYEETVR